MINWSSLFLVAGVSVGATLLVVGVFSIGMRLLTTARNIADNAKKGGTTSGVEVINRIGAYVFFTVAASAVLYGIYLIVPYFHLAK